MRSLAERPRGARRALEVVLRAAAFALLALALWLELRPAGSDADGVRRAAGAEMAEALGRWSADPDARRLHAAFEAMPADTTRDWLRALRGAGAEVGWSAPELPAVAIAAEPIADPVAPVRLLGAAPHGSELAFADAVASLGSSVAAGGGASATVGAVAGHATATVNGVTATAPAPAPLELRPVLVVGRAGWESGFVATALEERGWRLVTRMSVAPGVQVTQGSLGAIDTSTFAAVVALDSSAAPLATAIARYVRSGGGLVLGAEASTLPALEPLAAGRLAATERGDADLLVTGEPRRGLPLRPVALRTDAVSLERRGASVAVAARRVGAGRVVQLGYDETWRWRMAGADGAPGEHRAWWSGLVAAAAYAPATDTAADDGERALDDAPVARLIAALGPPSRHVTEAASDGGGERGNGAPAWIFPLVALLLLVEWASRRLRGAR